VKTFYVHPGDTWRVFANDATHLDTGPVTSGATGVVQLVDHLSDALVGVPWVIDSHSDDDWYVNITLPAQRGTYRAEIRLVQGGAAHTDHVLFVVNV
jgi:hypothetical protein